MTDERAFWTDDGVAIILWCVYETRFEKPRCFAAFAHLPDAENYMAAMQRLNPKRKFDVVPE